MQGTNYDQIADWYDEQVRAGTLIHDLVLPALFALIGEVNEQHICDLVCGQGVVCNMALCYNLKQRLLYLLKPLLALLERLAPGSTHVCCVFYLPGITKPEA